MGDKETAVALKLMGYKSIPFGGNMKVETYEIEEPKAEPQLEAEAIDLIEKLGLEGQKSLVVDTGETERRIPYREVTASEKVIFESVFSKTEDVKKYSEGIIPVRILQVISHGKDLFERVDVRSGESGALLIGVNGRYSNEKWFPLARWGVELPSMAKLREDARRVIKNNFEKSLLDCIEKCQSMRQSVDSLVERRLSGDAVSIPTVY